MSTFSSAISSPRFQRRFLYVALFVLAAGVVAFVAVRVGSRGDVKPVARDRGATVNDVSKVPKTAKLSADAKKVAQDFILSAVARKDLRHAYALVGPQIKQGQTLKEWMTGNIAVVPYPVDNLALAKMKIDYSYANETGIEVALLPAPKSGQKPIIFYMNLIKQNGRWLVNSWVPRSAPEVPLAPN
jgi:hypothetical protein